MGDAPPEETSKSFWGTAPGIITAIAGLVTAVGGLVGALAAAGVIGGGDDSPPTTILTFASEPTTGTTAATTPPATEASVTQPTVTTATAAPEERSTVNIVYTGDTDGCVLNIEITIGDQTAMPIANPFTMTEVLSGAQNYDIVGAINCFSGSCTATGAGALDIRDNASYFIGWQQAVLGQCDIWLVEG